MDWMQVATGALFLLNLITIAFAKVLWGHFQEVKKRGEVTAAEVTQLRMRCGSELADFKVEVAKTYVSTQELTHAMEGIQKTLERIETKLDNKQDKP